MHTRGITSRLLAGSRFWNTPKWATVVIPTPCPCAMGAWTGLQAGPDAKVVPDLPSMKEAPTPNSLENPPAELGVGDSITTDITIPNFVQTPTWQEDKGMMLDNVGT